jgi:hypothetical protein
VAQVLQNDDDDDDDDDDKIITIIIFFTFYVLNQQLKRPLTDTGQTNIFHS